MRATAAHLGDLDIFRGLGPDERTALAERFQYRAVEGGAHLIREGEASRRLYIVVSGRFAVSRGDGPVLAVIARGEPVGEIGFFTNAARTADVIALRDSEVLAIERSDFDALAETEPILWRSTMIALARRLESATAQTMIARTQPSQPRTVLVCPAGRGQVSRDFGFALEDALAALAASAMLLDEAVIRDATGETDISAPEVGRWLNAQEAAHDLTLWLASGEETDWARKAVRQADAALLVATEGPETLGAVERWAAERLGPEEIRLAVPEGRASPWLETRRVGASHRVGTPREIDSLARFLCGKARGLVLGGGGALAGAHVGTVFALREAGVEFDSFAGTSAGGAIAGALALGLDREEIIARCEDIFLANRALKHWTVPRHGLIDATVVDAMVRKHYGTGLIEDLPAPFRAIATDLSDGDMHVMARGPLWQAIRATCSIPVLLPPFIDGDGRILVDGGITDNLPVDPMRASKRGPNLAIMLGQARWRRARHSYDAYPGRGALLLETLLPWRKSAIKAPRLGQIMTRSMLLGSDAASQRALARADVVFNPPLPKGMGITDWKRFKALERDSRDWAKAEIERRLRKDPTALDAFRQAT